MSLLPHEEPIPEITNIKKHLVSRVLELREAKDKPFSYDYLINRTIESTIAIYEANYGKFPYPDEPKQPRINPTTFNVGDFYVQ